jgi:hypothetical protein
LNTKTKQVLSGMAFKTTGLKTMAIDHNKPIAVLAGQDSFSLIGLPPSLMSDVIGKQIVPTLEQWKTDFSVYFRPKPPVAAEEPVDISPYPEVGIDTLRDQKLYFFIHVELNWNEFEWQTKEM